MDFPCRTPRLWPAFSRTKLAQIPISAALFILLGLFCCPTNAATLVVPPGGDLQAAINAASFGDTIILQSGAVYQTLFLLTPYVLTYKGPGSGYITITSSTPPPPDGTRVTLADRANMAKCVVRGGSAFFEARAGAHHYRISGLYITNTANTGSATQLLSDNGYDIALDGSNWPHDIIIDHNWFNPVEWDLEPEANLYSSANAAVGMVGRNVTIRDNVMKGFGCRYASDHLTILDSEAVIIGTAPGPMLIDNNFM